MPKKILFIVNPKAGIVPKNKNFIDWIAEIANNFVKHDLEVKYSDYAGHAVEIAKEAKGKYDIVVSVGGDGTLNQIASQLVDSDTVLGIIPGGSGNGLAHFLKIPMTSALALNVISKGKIKKIDTASVNNEFFLSISGLGFDAHVAKEFEKSNIRGMVSYLKVIIQEYPNYKEKKYTIDIDGRIIEKEAIMVVVANSNQFGFNARIAPKAKIDDGLLDVCVISKIPTTDVIFFLYSLMRGELSKKYVDYYKGKDIKIINNETNFVNVDGEAFEMKMPISYSVSKRALKVIVP